MARNSQETANRTPESARSDRFDGPLRSNGGRRRVLQPGAGTLVAAALPPAAAALPPAAAQNDDQNATEQGDTVSDGAVTGGVHYQSVTVSIEQLQAIATHTGERTVRYAVDANVEEAAELEHQAAETAQEDLDNPDAFDEPDEWLEELEDALEHEDGATVDGVEADDRDGDDGPEPEPERESVGREGGMTSDDRSARLHAMRELPAESNENEPTQFA